MSRFWTRLGTESSKSENDAGGTAGVQQEGRRGGPSVVLVDAHEAYRRATCRTLEAAGIRILGESAETYQAWRLAAAFSPDIVITDLAVPVFGGLLLARMVIEELPFIRVIVLTDLDDQWLRQTADLVGVYDYLLKSSPARVLVKAIRAAAHPWSA